MAKPTISLSDTIATWITKTNILVDDVGNKDSLSTSVSSDIIKALNGLKTSDILENTNLYYTSTRADSDAKNAISAAGSLVYSKTTGVITSTYNFDSDFALKNTGNLAEGSNLYYTTARADSDTLHAITKTFLDGLNISAGSLGSRDSDYFKNAGNISAGQLSVARLPVATAAEYSANVSSKVLTTDAAWATSQIVALTDAATISLDANLGINFSVVLGGNRTLANPTNVKIGQSGFIKVNQDATGSRTLAYGTSWKFSEGSAPVLEIAANALDLLFYLVIDATTILVTHVRDVR